MAVSILFNPATGCTLEADGSFLLESSGGSRYGLPRLSIAPAGDNAPHVFEIEAHTSGLEAEAEERLFQRYRVPGGRSRSDGPRLWDRERVLPPGGIDLADAPSVEHIELTLTVHYYDSDTDGKAIADRPLSETATVVMRIAREAVPEPTEVGADDKPIRLRVSPDDKALYDGEDLSVQLLLITDRDSDQAPHTALADSADGLGPGLRARIDAALAAAQPHKDPLPRSDGDSQWRLDLRLELDKTAREELRDQAGGLVQIPLVSRLGDAVFQHALSIGAGDTGDFFSDWICIDFGTSSSTVALFDQKRVPEPSGLPKEQLAYFGRAMLDWLDGDSGALLSGQTEMESEWRHLLDEIGDGDPDAVKAPFRNTDEHRMFDIVRRIETAALSPRTRRVVWSRLNRILEQTFRTPPLSQQTIFPVELHEASRSPIIPSEVRVDGLDPLRVTIGDDARAARQQAEALEPDTRGRFQIGYKQHLATAGQFTLALDDDEPRQIAYDDLIREGWRELVRLSDAYRARNPERHSRGRVRKAIITYPTVSPPVVRRRIVELAEAIGIPSVETRYDEAVASAVFFLMRELGGEMDFGLESFASRSRPLDDSGTRWAQNVLVFDVGGGTTDIALIRLTLSDQTLSLMEDGPHHGAGGRYYKITPEILGSSGHMQLGGDLVSLKTFLGIKALLAEQILECCGDDPQVVTVASSFGDDLRDEVSGDYAPGRITQRIFEGINAKTDQDDNPAYNGALNAAEALIPTRWARKDGDARARARQAFNLLWDLAEEAKKFLGRRTAPGESVAPFEPRRKVLDELLDVLGLDPSGDGRSRMVLSLTVDLFERLARPSIREAARIARGLLESRLPRRKDAQGRPRREELDWLILSGQTCRLGLVDKELRRELESAEVFSWNPDKVTFDSAFAKLATCLGACWAEHLRVHVSSAEGSVPMLRHGSSLLHFDVKNLFFFLPCLFELRAQGRNRVPLFNAHDKLRKLDDDEMGKARTPWSKGTMLKMSVFRKDFDTEEYAQHWCDFDATGWAKAWGMSDEEWRSRIRYQLEVDQTLRMRLLLCRGRPHYCVDSGDAEHARVSIPNVLAELDGNQILACDVVVRLNSGGNPRARDYIFKAGSTFDHDLHRDPGDSAPVKAMISEPLPEFYVNEYHVVHTRTSGDDEAEWTKAGEIARPGASSDFEQRYYATLDVEGTLTFHAGSVPYWTSDGDPSVLRHSEGRVHAIVPDSTRPGPDNSRNAFCGIH